MERKIRLYEVVDTKKGGDSYSDWAYSIEDAEKIASDTIYHLTDCERKYRTIEIIGRQLTVNFDEQAVKGISANELDNLLNDDDNMCYRCFELEDNGYVYPDDTQFFYKSCE